MNKPDKTIKLQTQMIWLMNVKELKMYLEMYYSMLGKTDNYREEEKIDGYIHDIKKELSMYGIYVQEKIKPKYIKK